MEYISRKNNPTKGLLYGFGIDDTHYTKERRISLPNGGTKLVWIDDVYTHWKLMLRRVFKDTHYEDVCLQKSWLLFSNYLDWFNKNAPCIDTHEDLVVDKDLLSKGRLTYSESTCIILPQRFNSSLISSMSKNSDMPIGVYFDKTRNNYQGYCMTYKGKRKAKRFQCHLKAHKFWQKNKIEYFNDILNDPITNKLNPFFKVGISEIISNLTRDMMTGKITTSLTKSGIDIKLQSLEDEYE